MLYTMRYESPVGPLLLVERDGALAGVWMEGQKYYLGTLRDLQGEMQENADSKVLNGTKDWLDRYFKGEKPVIGELVLHPEGSEFQKEVWKILCKIPYGETRTYRDIAREIAAGRSLESMSAQAVGGAVGHNPISIIIPCHRVVGTDGSLRGYAGGLEKKRKLLALEGVDMGELFIPASSGGFDSSALKHTVLMSDIRGIL